MFSKSWKAVFAQIDLKQAVVTFADGTGTPIVLIIKIGEGNLTFTEAVTREYTLDRGNLDLVRNGDEVPVEVSLDATWEYITGGDASAAIGTIVDFLKGPNLSGTPYTANVTSDTADSCAPYAIDVIVTYTPICSGSGVAEPNETITLPDFRYESVAYDLSAGTFAITGKCNVVEATVARSA